ncbi:MAG: DUF4388 domain-containing protein [Oscillochloris sp.]|nr:DUF4388 domain-containing protein [Oscillochloris sp.]
MFLGGDFAMLSPASLLQMLGQEQRSVQIKAWRGNSEATVQLLEGMIVAATCDELSGEEALFRLAIWDSGRFQVVPLDDSAAPDMTASWEELLLEAAAGVTSLNLPCPSCRSILHGRNWKRCMPNVPNLAAWHW